MCKITPVPGGPDEFANADEVDTSFPLGVWVFNKLNLRVLHKARNLGDWQKIVDSFAIMLKMEACILESSWIVDDCLSDFMNLLLGRDLRFRRVSRWGL